MGINRSVYKALKIFIPRDVLFEGRIRFWKAASIFYRGSRYTCPICNKSFRRMLPGNCKHPQVLVDKKVVGAGPNQNNICPYCYSGARERAVYLAIKDRIDYAKILHIAPERNLKKILRCNIGYVSGDITTGIDVRKLQWSKNTFDAVICNHVLEHVDDDRKAISEIYRVLKPKGWAVLQVPISLSLKKTFEDPKIKTSEQREEFYGQKDHMRLYAQDYKKRLEKVGFDVELINIWPYLKEKYCLIKEEKIYFCVK